MVDKDDPGPVLHDAGADIVHGHAGAVIVDHAGVTLDKGKSVVQALPLLLGDLAVSQACAVYAGQLGHGSHHQLAPVLFHGQVVGLYAVAQAQGQSQSEVCFTVAGTACQHSNHLFPKQSQFVQFAPCHFDAGVRLLQPLHGFVPDLRKIFDVRVHALPAQMILHFQGFAHVPADAVRVRCAQGHAGGQFHQQALAVVLHHKCLIVLHMADGGHGFRCAYDQGPEITAQHPLQYHCIHIVATVQLQLDGSKQLPVWAILKHGRCQALHGGLARRRVKDGRADHSQLMLLCRGDLAGTHALTPPSRSARVMSLVILRGLSGAGCALCTVGALSTKSLTAKTPVQPFSML